MISDPDTISEGSSWLNIEPDVEFFTGYKVLGAHKVILASRSPVFEKMFTSHSNNSRKLINQVVKDAKKKSFESFLDYMYDSKMYAMIYSDHYEIIQLAEKYQVKSLLQWYAHYIYLQGLDIRNAMTCLLAAILSEQTLIIKAVVSFIRENFSDIDDLRNSTFYGKAIDEIFKRKDVLHNLLKYGWELASYKKVNIWTPAKYLNAEKYYNSKEFSDITIHVGKTSIRAHKAILALRSKVFEELLAEKYPNEEDNELYIDDVDEKTFQLFLVFLYSNKLPFSQIDMNLFLAATKYKLGSLVDICQMKFIDELRVDNVLNYFQKSLEHECQVLSRYAQKFASDRNLMIDCNFYTNGDIEMLKKAVFTLMEYPDFCDYNKFSLDKIKIPYTPTVLIHEFQKTMDLNIEIFVYRMETWERGFFRTKLESFLRPDKCMYHPKAFGSVNANDFGFILVTEYNSN